MNLFQTVFKGIEGLLDNLDSLRERACQFTTRSIQMSTTIEELCCYLIAGEVVDRAQRHPYHLLLGVFTQRDAELQPSASPLIKWKRFWSSRLSV